MKSSGTPQQKNLFNQVHPVALITGALMYTLGAGIANYLGHTIHWTAFWLGMACIILLQLSSFFLHVYYEGIYSSSRGGYSTIKITGADENWVRRNLFLLSAMTTLAVGAALTVILFANRFLTMTAFLFLGMGFVLTFFYSVPPLRLVYSGYGELSNAIFLANIVPVMGFLLQVGDLHRLLAMLTFPLTALTLASQLASSLRHYAEDFKSGRKTLLVRIGWPKGMVFHNMLILAAYLLLSAGAIMGLPWPLVWPALLSLPLGLLEIWEIHRLTQGLKPRWSTLMLISQAMLIVTVYLICLSLWVL